MQLYLYLSVFGQPIFFMPQEEYLEYFELSKLYEESPRLIKSRPLYDSDVELIFKRISDRLGENAPLSPLIGNIAMMLANYGYELNHFPYQMLVELFRWQGVEIQPALYPVINLRFVRDRASLQSAAPVIVPLGTEVKSSRNPNLVAITTSPRSIPSGSGEEYLDVPARLNSFNTPVSSLAYGEFSIVNSLPGIATVFNDGHIFSGRKQETLSEACLRARQENLRGRRCVTPRDFLDLAYSLGATKVRVLPRIQKGVSGVFANLVTVAIHPAGVIDAVQTEIDRQKIAGTWAVAVPPDTKTVTGSFTIRTAVDSTLSTTSLTVKSHIVENLNPPKGVWGNANLPSSLATSLLSLENVYGVEGIDLFIDGVSWDEYKPIIEPWDLFEFDVEQLKISHRN